MFTERTGGTANPADRADLGLHSQGTSSKAGLQRAALTGIAGEFVSLVGPHTEGDPAALLFQFLAAFGNAAGRKSYVLTDSSRQYPNLFVTIVGRSAKGRKGTSWGHVANLFGKADADWFDHSVLSGLTSGEGLIAAVQDPPIDESPESAAFPPIGRTRNEKRRLFIESEFAGLLKVMQRDGSRLSPVLRDAWDGSALNVLTRQEPLRATNAHISVVGHITETELRRYLSNVDLFNGFANRFLWVSASRSKMLPLGGRVPEQELAALAKRLCQSIHFADAEKELLFEGDAEELWCEMYRSLGHEKSGLVGTVTARGEPMVRRLSLIYALLDCSLTVKRVHLEAGYAAWNYTDETCHRLFHQTDDEERVLEALEESPSGLTKTKISGLFKRNKSRTEINELMSGLVEKGRVKLIKDKDRVIGRPSEYWHLLRPERPDINS